MRSFRKFGRKIKMWIRKRELPSLWKKLPKYLRKVREGWQDAQSIDKIGVTASVLSVVIGVWHLIAEIHDLAGSGRLFFFQTILLLAGLGAVLIQACARLGAVRQQMLHLESTHRNTITTLEAAHKAEIDKVRAESLNINSVQDAQKRDLQARSNRRRSVLTACWRHNAEIQRDILMSPNAAIISPEKTVAALGQIATNISEVLNELSHGDYHLRTTIKAVVGYADLLTVARDRRTLETFDPFGDLNRISKIGENTAFLHTVSGVNLYFASDCLSSLPNYENTNPIWRRIYDGTAVASIRRDLVGPAGGFELAGYIGVDYLPKPGEEFFFARGAEDSAIRDFLLGNAALTFGILKRGLTASPNTKRPLNYVVDSGNFEFVRSLNHVYAMQKRLGKELLLVNTGYEI